jgi:hypothetical protein
MSLVMSSYAVVGIKNTRNGEYHGDDHGRAGNIPYVGSKWFHECSPYLSSKIAACKFTLLANFVLFVHAPMRSAVCVPVLIIP